MFRWPYHDFYSATAQEFTMKIKSKIRGGATTGGRGCGGGGGGGPFPTPYPRAPKK
jgi:hypothetical protein